MRIIIVSFLILFLFLVLIISKPLDVFGVENLMLIINQDLESKSIPDVKNMQPSAYENYFSSECESLEDFSQPLTKYQFGQFDEAESEFRALVKKHPMCADSRAALTALLWHKGYIGEAESHWNAAFGLDNRYSNKEWLLNTRHWPAKPTEDLVAFLEWIKR